MERAAARADRRSGYRRQRASAGGAAATLEELRRLAQALTEEFGLVGLNGIDFVLRGPRPVIVEVNPRYSASMELVERATGIADLRSSPGRLPRADCRSPGTGRRRVAPPAPTSRFHGKAIVYAPELVSIAGSIRWIERGVRDVPHPGEVIRTRSSDLHRARLGPIARDLPGQAPGRGGRHSRGVRTALDHRQPRGRRLLITPSSPTEENVNARFRDRSGREGSAVLTTGAPTRRASRRPAVAVACAS